MIPLKICKFLYENSIQMTVGRNCYEKRLIRNGKTIIDQGIYHEPWALSCHENLLQLC